METRSLLRVASVNAVGFSASTVMPLWLGGVAHAFGMPAWFAGAAVVAQLGGAALFNLLTPVLFGRFALLPLARTALLVAAAAYMLAVTTWPALFIAACLISGAALGTVLNVTNRMMGSGDHVQKGYAIFLLVEICFATAVFLGSSALMARFGLRAAFPVVSVAALIAFLLLLKLRGDMAPATAPDRQPRSAHHGRALMALGAFALFFIGQATLNSFMPTIGQAAGLDAQGAAQVNGLGMPFGFAGAIVARLVGERVPPIVPVAIVVVLLGCVAPLLTLAPTVPLFAMGVVTLAVSTMFSVPYFFAHLATMDGGGRYTAFGPAMMLAGIAAGPSVAVLLDARFGLEAVGLFSAALLLIGGAVFWLSSRPEAPRVLEPALP